jgi:hypothetical protein
MDLQKTINKLFQIKRGRLLKGIKSSKLARDSAPSAMESHHDTTRNQNEKLVNELEIELGKIDEIIAKAPENFVTADNNLKVGEWRYVEVSLNSNLLKLCIVPEGIGGEVIDNIRLISSSTPLGKVILNKKTGETFSFNGQSGKIEEIQ